jgi:hypothetical protein
MILFWLIIGAFLRAVWHISLFKPKYGCVPQWEYPFNIKRPPLDSMHVYGGLFTLWYIFIILLQPDIIWLHFFNSTSSVMVFSAHLVLYWFFFFYWFNIFYHIILIKRGYRNWNYLFYEFKLLKTKL